VVVAVAMSTHAQQLEQHLVLEESAVCRGRQQVVVVHQRLDVPTPPMGMYVQGHVDHVVVVMTTMMMIPVLTIVVVRVWIVSVLIAPVEFHILICICR